ncbi:hypothetical protein KY366_00970 [Candidatus Woesearchaeota archaeon]|nr:hypothetical protein [Candidatus Woesearchaeota archaeon]
MSIMKGTRRMKYLWDKDAYLIATALLAILLAVFAGYAYAFPSPAMEFYGNITMNDSLALPGVNVTAYDADNVVCGYFVVSNEGYYGSLSCNGDDASTAADEGAEDGDTILFYVNSSRAFITGNTTWHSGAFSFVNLSIKEYAPTFDHDLTTQYVNESERLVYDVNCSDMNVEDVLTYYDNTTRFDIDPVTGMIDWMPGMDDIGNHSMLITCSDGELNASGILLIIVYVLNFPPVMDPIGPQIAVVDEAYFYDVNATDRDVNDTLVYSANTTLFDIDNATGEIGFTPAFSQIGNYSINISVSDGLAVDYEVVYFRVVRGPYCGDGSCGSGENCLTCPADCGKCRSVPGAGAAGAAALSQAAAYAAAKVCDEKWECTEWSRCTPEGIQTRVCIDVNKCNTEKDKPSEVRQCEYIPTCFDGIQNGDEEGVDCGGSCTPCPTIPTCFDGIQNQDEEGVDCGGPCRPCEVRKYARVPMPELAAPLAKSFPWFMLFIVAVLLSFTVAGDWVYLRRITKKEFAEYRRKMRRYKRIRKRIYITSIILSFIGLTSVFYIYIMSDKPELMNQFIWIPASAVIAVMLSAFFIVRHFRYYEYRRRKKEEEFLLEHKRRRESFIRLKDKLLISLESKMLDKIRQSIKQEAFKGETLRSIKDISAMLDELDKKRKEKMLEIKTEEGIKNKISQLLGNLHLAELSKDYPEFKGVVTALRGLKDKRIENFLLSMALVSQDKHLISVIKSSEELIGLYNQLVDVYDSYKNQIDNKEMIEENLIKEEAEFMKMIGDMTNDSRIMGQIKENPKNILIYNSLVDIFNEYKRRQELHNEMKKGLRRG